MTSIQSILVVDDDPAMLELAVMSLTQLGGFNVKQAASGEAALAVLDTFRPDLILLDSNMPGMDGPATLKALQEDAKFKKIPVAFITGESQQAVIDRLLALGAISVITKPYDPMTLPDQINQLS